MRRTMGAIVVAAALLTGSCATSGSVEETADDDGPAAESGDALGEEDDDEDPREPDSDGEEAWAVVSGDFLRDFTFDLPLFDEDSAWNQRADDAAVLATSDLQIRSLYRVLLGDWSTLAGYDGPATEWPYMGVNVDDWTIPIARTGDGEQEVLICADDGEVGWANPKWEVESLGGPVTAPAPAAPVRPAGPEGDDNADAWLVLYDPDTEIAYDYFAATPHRDDECRGFVGGQVGARIEQAGEVDFFDAYGPGLNPDGVSSARAAGTPLLAGMLLPEDVENGAFEHAFAIAIPAPRNTSDDPTEPLPEDVFYPASTTETDFYNTDPYAIASGQRLRLKSSLVDDDGEPLDEDELAPITRMFLQGLRDFGAYVVDNSGGLTFYAEDSHTAVLHLDDDEVNALIGEPAGTPLPRELTSWQVVIRRLLDDLERIPVAVSPGDDEPDPETAEIETANFEVVEPATQP